MARSSASANLGSLSVDGCTMIVADKVPQTFSLTNSTASSRKATGSALPMVVSLMTEHHGSIVNTLSAPDESTSSIIAHCSVPASALPMRCTLGCDSTSSFQRCSAPG